MSEILCFDKHRKDMQNILLCTFKRTFDCQLLLHSREFSGFFCDSRDFYEQKIAHFCK